jgi:predicted lipoprotein with Yx(FWY)xxD motif
MSFRSRAITLSVLSAAVLAGSGWGVSSAFGAPQHAPAKVVFKSEHIAKVKGAVLVEGKGLVVYTFTGDKRGKAGTCTGQCAAIWPPVRGVAALAHGVKLSGKFGRINGQITYNGWPLYGFTGQKPGQNHTDSGFKVVPATAPAAAKSKPAPAPAPTATPSGGAW